MSESHIQKEILDYLRAKKIAHIRLPIGPVIHNGIRKKSSLKGLPDICGIIPKTEGRLFCIEVKDKDGILSDIQKEKHKCLEDAGVLIIVARSLAEVASFF